MVKIKTIILINNYKKEKSITKTHHETRETKDRKCCTGLLPDYCQIGAVKPDPHKQPEVFVNKLFTILDNRKMHLYLDNVIRSLLHWPVVNSN